MSKELLDEYVNQKKRLKQYFERQKTGDQTLYTDQAKLLEPLIHSQKETQLNHMEKTGGFIPLLTLIPIIASALGAAGGLAGGISRVVSDSKSNYEQARHNDETARHNRAV